MRHRAIYGAESGDTILTYTYLGEGFSVVWSKGKFYREYDITFAKWPDEAAAVGLTARRPMSTSGKGSGGQKVKLRSGVVGWVNMDKAKFSGVNLLA